MRKLLIVVAALALVLDAGMASAAGCRRGCGGRRACHSCAAPAGCSTCATGCATCAAAPAACPGGVCAVALAGDLGTQAAMLVELPADATLTVDGVATTSTSASRLLVTPPLEAGKTFHYTLTAQVVRDGNVQTVTRQVAVRAGEETHVTLDVPVAAVAVR